MAAAKVVRAPPGLGKTTVVVHAIAGYGGAGRVEYYVPTHELAKEVRTVLQAANPSMSMTVIGGRSHTDADGAPLCKKHKLAEDISKAGGDVYGSLCIRKKGKARVQCEHYASCPYIKQFTESDVRFYPHAYLPLRRMAIEGEIPAVAVIDESFFQSCVEIIEMPIRALSSSSFPQNVGEVLQHVARGLRQGVPLLQHLEANGIGYRELRQTGRALMRARPKISPASSPADFQAALKELRNLTAIGKLVATLCVEHGTGRAHSIALTYCADTEQCTVHRKRSIGRFSDRKKGESRLLFIDGNADKTIIEAFVGRAEFTDIPATRNVRVIQVGSSRCSTTSFVPEKNQDRKSKAAAKKKLGELQLFIDRVASEHQRVLVIGPQAITGNLRQGIKPLLKKPGNVDFGHFGAIRGVDKWKDFDAIILIGRNEPPTEAVEAIARCIFQASANAPNFSGRRTTQKRGYRLRAGKVGVDVVVHDDPAVQAVLEQMREGESLQAIDRLRLIHSTRRKTVYVLSSVPLDIEVEDLVAWDDLIHGSRVKQALNRNGGVLPLNPQWLAARHPDLWKSVAAAKNDVGRAIKKDHFSNINSISNLSLLRRQYRLPSQRRWSVCLSRAEAPGDVALKLQDLVGGPVIVRAMPSSSHPSADRGKAPPARRSSHPEPGLPPPG